MKKSLLLGLSVAVLFAGGLKTMTVTYNPKQTNNILLLKLSSDYQKTALTYLNFLRQKAGMIDLNENKYLDKAAVNHAKYIDINKLVGHYENENNEGFTGVTPSDRAIEAGYQSNQVIENLSYGDSDVNKSIDNLFNTLYHRLGFLSSWINDIGIGAAGKAYIYDMGNSYLNELCNSPQKEITGAYYKGICANKDLKISVTDVNNAKEKVELQNKQIILWPVNKLAVDPVFYDSESPDPLPNNQMSGYPVTVQFNPYYYNKINMIDFRLYDSSGNEVNSLTYDKESDPNQRMNGLEFALFPIKRLEWGSKYTAVFDYDVNGSEKELKWSFSTKALPYPYYRITSDEFNATILPDKEYAFYFVPKNDEDKFRSMSAGYSVQKLDFSFIDFNTVRVRLIGKAGQKAAIKLGDKKLNLVIGKSEEPKPFQQINNDENSSLNNNNKNNIANNQSNKENSDINASNKNNTNIATDNKNDYFKNILANINEQWQLKGALEDVDLKNYNNTEFLLWEYKNNEWCIYTNKKELLDIIKKENIKFCDTIKKGDGFWIKR